MKSLRNQRSEGIGETKCKRINGVCGERQTCCCKLLMAPVPCTLMVDEFEKSLLSEHVYKNLI
jgi:hypothetical protein